MTPTYIELEHSLALIMAEQERTGFPFDVEKAKVVRAELSEQFETMKEQMKQRFFGVPAEMKLPKVNSKKRGVYKGCPYRVIKEFNPTSRQHIAHAMQRLGAIFDQFTTSGLIKIDEDILNTIAESTTVGQPARDAAKQFAELLKLQKWLGQLSEGNNSWFNTVESDNTIHHSCVLATQTGRNAHRGPNLGQVVSAPWARALFTAHEDMVLLGTDLKGLELRALGHYLQPYDNGAFAEVVVNGDVHAQNAERVGCTRDQVKGLTYGFIYGAGDAKLGKLLYPTLTETQQKSKGKDLRKKFLDAIPGLDPLIKDVRLKVKEEDGFEGLDGRPIICTAEHAALNYLLQSAGAVLSKRWVVITNQMLAESFEHEKDYYNCCFIHDEQELSVRPAIADAVKEIVTKAAIKAGEFYNFCVKIEADCKVGQTWQDVH